MKKTYKRYFGLVQDICKLLWRTKLPLDKKNQITLLITNGFLKHRFKIYNKRYENEYLFWSDLPNKYLVFEACPKENLRIILNKKLSKDKEQRINYLIKKITTK